MKWKDLVYHQVIAFCNQQGSRTFTLKDFICDTRAFFAGEKPGNHHVDDKVRQQLQFLRNVGLISFLDNSGHYTLRGEEFLGSEKDEMQTIDLRGEPPHKREYLMETYVRNTVWARKAVELLGSYCLVEGCTNTFRREDGSPYCEVHHIVPLCLGGEDGNWNLSILCAHHHRMTHFADDDTKQTLQKILQRNVSNRLMALKMLP